MTPRCWATIFRDKLNPAHVKLRPLLTALVLLVSSYAPAGFGKSQEPVAPKDAAAVHAKSLSPLKKKPSTRKTGSSQRKTAKRAKSGSKASSRRSAARK